VLLVEDDEDDFILVRHILGSPSFALTWCSSAEAAREHLDGRSL
jgi:DNA-binding response OmpR family regulator